MVGVMDAPKIDAACTTDRVEVVPCLVLVVASNQRDTEGGCLTVWLQLLAVQLCSCRGWGGGSCYSLVIGTSDTILLELMGTDGGFTLYPVWDISDT